MKLGTVLIATLAVGFTLASLLGGRSSQRATVPEPASSFADTKVEIACAGAALGIQCSVAHREGRARVRACWDVSILCQNSTEVTGSACQTVAPMQTTSTTIPETELRNIDQCDSTRTFAVENLRLSAAP